MESIFYSGQFSRTEIGSLGDGNRDKVGLQEVFFEALTKISTCLHRHYKPGYINSYAQVQHVKNEKTWFTWYWTMCSKHKLWIRFNLLYSLETLNIVCICGETDDLTFSKGTCSMDSVGIIWGINLYVMGWDCMGPNLYKNIEESHERKCNNDLDWFMFYVWSCAFWIYK